MTDDLKGPTSGDYKNITDFGATIDLAAGLGVQLGVTASVANFSAANFVHISPSQGALVSAGGVATSKTATTIVGAVSEFLGYLGAAISTAAAA